jgi:hypothetical protein
MATISAIMVIENFYYFLLFFIIISYIISEVSKGVNGVSRVATCSRCSRDNPWCYYREDCLAVSIPINALFFPNAVTACWRCGGAWVKTEWDQPRRGCVESPQFPSLPSIVCCPSIHLPSGFRTSCNPLSQKAATAAVPPSRSNRKHPYFKPERPGGTLYRVPKSSRRVCLWFHECVSHFYTSDAVSFMVKEECIWWNFNLFKAEW